MKDLKRELYILMIYIVEPHEMRNEYGRQRINKIMKIQEGRSLPIGPSNPSSAIYIYIYITI